MVRLRVPQARAWCGAPTLTSPHAWEAFSRGEAPPTHPPTKGGSGTRAGHRPTDRRWNKQTTARSSVRPRWDAEVQPLRVHPRAGSRGPTSRAPTCSLIPPASAVHRHQVDQVALEQPKGANGRASRVPTPPLTATPVGDSGHGVGRGARAGHRPRDRGCETKPSAQASPCRKQRQAQMGCGGTTAPRLSPGGESGPHEQGPDVQPPPSIMCSTQRWALEGPSAATSPPPRLGGWCERARRRAGSGRGRRGPRPSWATTR